MTRPRNILLALLAALFSPLLAIAFFAVILTTIVRALFHWRDVP